MTGTIIGSVFAMLFGIALIVVSSIKFAQGVVKKSMYAFIMLFGFVGFFLALFALLGTIQNKNF